MATSMMVAQVTDSESSQLPQIPTLRDEDPQRLGHALSTTLQMPRLGEVIQIPGLGNVENSPATRPNISDFGCHDINAPLSDTLSSPSSTVEPESPLLNAINNAPASIDGLPVESSSTQESSQEEEITPGVAMTQQAADDEWQRQFMKFKENGNIHHFNFLGDGMPYKNATPPAVSLFAAVRGAKTGLMEMPVDKNKETSDISIPPGYALMRNAMKYVDPVIYHGRRENLLLGGEDLRETATGLCEKFYSEHDTWRNDKYDECEDRPRLDEMEVLDYPFESLPVNGWFRHERVMSRETLREVSWDVSRWLTDLLQQKLKQRRASRRKASPLQEMTMLDDLNAVAEKKSDIPQTSTSSKSGDAGKTSASGWTVDLDGFLGKCDNWADEIDDEYDTTPEPNAAVVVKTSSAAAQFPAVEETEAETEPDEESNSAQASDVVPLSEQLPELTSTSNSSIIDEDEATDSPSTPPEVQPAAMQHSIVSSCGDLTMVGQAVEGLTEEELQAEDAEIYGDPPAAPEELSLRMKRLHDSGLVTRDDGAGPPRQSSEKNDGQNSASTLNSEPVSLGGSFSLPIRPKPAATFDKAQTAPAATCDVNSLPMASVSFSLPMRPKVSAAAQPSKDMSGKKSARFVENNDATKCASVEEVCDSLLVQPPAPSLQETELDEDEDS